MTVRTGEQGVDGLGVSKARVRQGTAGAGGQ